MKRAGMLFGIDSFGNHSWYNEGASCLIDLQNPEGVWRMLCTPIHISQAAATKASPGPTIARGRPAQSNIKATRSEYNEPEYWSFNDSSRILP